MLEIIQQNSIVIMAGAYILGMFTGFILSMRYHRLYGTEPLSGGKIFAWFLATLWISFHVHSLLISGEKVATIFDVIGAMSVGSVLGFNVETLLSKIVNK